LKRKLLSKNLLSKNIESKNIESKFWFAFYVGIRRPTGLKCLAFNPDKDMFLKIKPDEFRPIGRFKSQL